MKLDILNFIITFEYIFCDGGGVALGVIVVVVKTKVPSVLGTTTTITAFGIVLLLLPASPEWTEKSMRC